MVFGKKGWIPPFTAHFLMMWVGVFLCIDMAVYLYSGAKPPDSHFMRLILQTMISVYILLAQPKGE
jgi:hypothetical protein